METCTPLFYTSLSYTTLLNLVCTFTVRNSSCRKVMFSQVSVCPRGMYTPQANTLSLEMATAADDTHPTGMHSCFCIVLHGHHRNFSHWFERAVELGMIRNPMIKFILPLLIIHVMVCFHFPIPDSDDS